MSPTEAIIDRMEYKSLKWFADGRILRMTFLIFFYLMNLDFHDPSSKNRLCKAVVRTYVCKRRGSRFKTG